MVNEKLNSAFFWVTTHICRISILVFAIYSSLVYSEEGKDPILVYSYHLKPPLVVELEAKKGLYFDFVDYLNANSKEHKFQLVHVPRKRIERLIDTNTLDGILLGVSPVWFQDREETKFLWTAKVFTDRDEVVSLKSNEVEFIDPGSIKNKTFGGVRGFYYYGINELVAQDKIVRVNTAKELDLFKLLLLERIDVAIISRSTFDYSVSRNNWQDKFYLSKVPHDIFDRRILVPFSQKKIYEELVVIVNKLQYDKNWQYKLLEYK